MTNGIKNFKEHTIFAIPFFRPRRTKRCDFNNPEDVKKLYARINVAHEFMSKIYVRFCQRDRQSYIKEAWDRRIVDIDYDEFAFIELNDLRKWQLYRTSKGNYIGIPNYDKEGIEFVKDNIPKWGYTVKKI